MFPDKLHVSCFQIIPTLCPDSGIVSPLWLCWVKGVCELRWNLPPALWAKWLGSFTCHCGNMGVEKTLSKSQHTKLSLKKKVLPPLLPRFELATFQSQVRCSYQQATTSYPSTHLYTSYITHTDINITHIYSLTRTLRHTTPRCITWQSNVGLVFQNWKIFLVQIIISR